MGKEETETEAQIINERAHRARVLREQGDPRYWAMIDAAIIRADGKVPDKPFKMKPMWFYH